ncbi:MAG TPA: 30S ribosomal protein S20 [bacterium (Candidatus Stahlbacteria)]|nr:30S ribosomal protein S20 [Candidatus Stahlbacteria bacterium]
MPHTKSVAKRVRQNEKRRLRNKAVKSYVRTMIKRVLESEDKEEALRKAYSALDKAVKKGVIHKNTAARKKSRLAKLVKKMASS